MHTLSQDPHLRQAWITKIPRKGAPITATSYICLLHFTSHDLVNVYNKRSGYKIDIKEGAIPTVFDVCTDKV
jgi:hypothetical protein